MSLVLVLVCAGGASRTFPFLLFVPVLSLSVEQSRAERAEYLALLLHSHTSGEPSSFFSLPPSLMHAQSGPHGMGELLIDLTVPVNPLFQVGRRD